MQAYFQTNIKLNYKYVFDTNGRVIHFTLFNNLTINRPWYN